MQEVLIDFTTITQDGENGLYSDKVGGTVSPQCYLTSAMLEIVS